MQEHPSPESIYEKYKDLYADTLKNFSPNTFAVWMLDVAARRLYYNHAYIATFTGDNPLPTSLDDWLALVHPEDMPSIKKNWLPMLNRPGHGDITEVPYRVRDKDNRYVSVLSIAVVVARNDQGKARYVVGVLISLSTLAAKLEAADTWRERAGFALDAARDGVWDWDTETDDVYYSPRYVAMLGYGPDYTPKTVAFWYKSIHPDDLEKTLLQQFQYINSPERGDIFESTYRFRTADGSHRWILSRGKVVARNADGKAKRVVGLHTDVTDLRTIQENLTELINHDSLTNLYSRLYFEQAFKNISPKDQPVSILYADVDTLKAVNDSLGHDAGDRLLVTAAELLRSVVRTSDITARIGGDEFAVIMHHCSSQTADAVIAKLKDLQRQRNNDPENMPVFLSLGAAGTNQGLSLDVLLHKADQAMLQQKELNREHSRAHMLNWIERRKARHARQSGKDS